MNFFSLFFFRKVVVLMVQIIHLGEGLKKSLIGPFLMELVAAKVLK